MNNDVIKYFREISEIPRGSGNEKNISDYFVAFAKEHNFNFIRDDELNVIIRKKASPGYEGRPAVVLQGHMDMVCEKKSDKEHDFTKDPISLRIDGDMIYAEGTTLGADDGIGIALGLAIMAADGISHPSLELLLTTDEERGMKGAANLDPGNIQGRILINIDSDQEGKFFVSCAGGPVIKTVIPLLWEKADKNMSRHAIRIRGLLGGHSGSDIDKGRGNANKLIGRILKEMEGEFDYRIASLNGGLMYNAIPREACAVIMIRPENKIEMSLKISELQKTIRSEFRASDPDIEVKFEEAAEEIADVFSPWAAAAVINYLYLAENGINTMSMDIPGLVESSVSLGVVRTEEDAVEFKALIRSSVKSIYADMQRRIENLAEITGGDAAVLVNCPLWQYNPDSKIQKVFGKVYRSLYGKEPAIQSIHVGLECGIFDEKFNGAMDMISYGPDVFDYHTPDEHFSISSAERSYEFLLEVLKEI